MGGESIIVKPKQDLVGKVFGRLTVIEQAEDYILKSGKHYAQWRCRCSCGNPNDVIVLQGNLIKGHTKSCGCWQQESRGLSQKGKHLVNEYEIKDGCAVFKDHKGKEFIVDIDDIDIVLQHRWFVDQNGYPRTSINVGVNQFRSLLLPRLLTGYNIVDHINRNPSDNRRSNLRSVNRTENRQNSKIRKDNTSGYPGVKKKGKKWQAVITVYKKTYYLGVYDLFEDAVKVRKEAEKKYFGEFAPSL